MNSFLLCCDWGTSSFRLRLVLRSSGDVHHEIRSADGISSLFHNWTRAGQKSAGDRETFYLNFLVDKIDQIAQRTGQNLDTVPVVITGMASSSIGIRELRYAETPFSLDGSSLVTSQLQTGNRHLILVSGLQTTHDVMRGEEVQVIGLSTKPEVLANSRQKIVVILPGTHSKHVVVQDSIIVNFSTAMTGELFDLLVSNGLLSYSVSKPNGTPEVINHEVFKEGVDLAARDELLHTLFRVRTNDLLHGLEGTDNYYYLSGLLIGAELSYLRLENDIQIVLMCGPHLAELYQIALEALGLAGRLYVVPPNQFDGLMVQGQMRIAALAGF